MMVQFAILPRVTFPAQGPCLKTPFRAPHGVCREPALSHVEGGEAPLPGARGCPPYLALPPPSWPEPALSLSKGTGTGGWSNRSWGTAVTGAEREVEANPGARRRLSAGETDKVLSLRKSSSRRALPKGPAW